MKSGKKKVITVFGSGHMEENFPEYQRATVLGVALAEKGFTVCNGGYGGIMEASARGAKQVGGKTLGIITKEMHRHANRWIDRVKAEKTWRDRLLRLIKTGDAFVVFDGGTGTLTELFTIWEMTNKQLISKPIIIHGLWMRAFVKRLRKQRLIIFNDFIQFAKSPRRVIQCLEDAFEEQEFRGS